MGRQNFIDRWGDNKSYQYYPPRYWSILKKSNSASLLSGVAASANLAVVKNLHLIATGFWSDGGGRYIGGLRPGFVVEQIGSKTGPFQAQLVHSAAGIASVEWQADKRNLLSVSHSDALFDRVFSTDPSTGTLVGYGFEGSANSNNRDISESTFASQSSLWKQKGLGSVLFITQGS
jgi:hypothetical protein